MDDAPTMHNHAVVRSEENYCKIEGKNAAQLLREGHGIWQGEGNLRRSLNCTRYDADNLGDCCIVQNFGMVDVGSGDVRNDEAVLNKPGHLCNGTEHDMGDPLFVYKLGLIEEELHPGDRAMLD